MDTGNPEIGRVVVGEWPIDSPGRAISRRTTIGLLTLVYFVSGICSLIDEVVWVRLLKLTLGNTVYASTIVVSTFMAGLAVGALIMSRYCDGIRKRLQLYALLEALITLSALSLPWALKLADTIYVWFYRTYDPSRAQLLAVQVIVSAGILLVPSMLMGTTLPLLGRFVTALEKEAGHLVGRLYALNTLGAALGCFLAGFVLIKALGVMGTLYTAAILNLMVACGGLCLSAHQGQDPAIRDTKIVMAKARDGRFHLLVFAFFMSGLISIGYELLWMRSVIHLLSAYTYVFSAVLTVYLLGNVIGAGIGSGLVRQSKNPAASFAVTLSLLALFGIFYLPLLLWWTSDLMPRINRELTWVRSVIPFSIYMVKPLVQSMFLFLVPAIIMGAGFPMALQAWTNHIHRVGRSTGTAYAANTIGAVTGGIITVFVLLPIVGFQHSMSILGLAGMWTAAGLCFLFVARRKVAARFGLLVLAAILTCFAVGVPSHLFETVVKSNPEIPERLDLLTVKEGAASTVSVYSDPRDGTLHLYTSGQKVAGDTYYWRGDQKMLGHFAVLLNSRAKNVLSVGFGAGESTACLALHDLERADCVEIAPEVVDVSVKYFSHINLADRLNDEINMIYMDAKNYVKLTDIKYDAIINDCIHPRQFAENASLYTKEYFESAGAHLTNGGLFVNWIPTHDVEPTAVLNSVIGTMMEAFPHVTIWFMTTHPAPYFLAIGSKQSQYFSPAHIERELLKDGVRQSLSLIDTNTSMDVLSCYVADEEDLSRHIRSYTVNSDYRPFIEFTTDNLVGGSQMFKRFVQDVRSDSVYKHIDWTGFNEEEKEKWLADYKQLYKASTYLLMSHATNNYLERLRCCMDGLSVLPNNPALLSVRDRTEKALLSVCVELTQSGRAHGALAMADKMLEIHPDSATAWIIKAAAWQERHDSQRAFDAISRALRLAPDMTEAHSYLGAMLFDRGQYEEAITEYRCALRCVAQNRASTRYDRLQILNALARTYAAAGRFGEAVDTAGQAYDIASTANYTEVAKEIEKCLFSYETACGDPHERQ